MPPIFNDKCTRCFKCVDVCPGDVLREGLNGPVVAYPDECWHCGACLMDCPSGAIKIILPLPLRPVTKLVK